VNCVMILVAPTQSHSGVDPNRRPGADRYGGIWDDLFAGLGKTVHANAATRSGNGRTEGLMAVVGSTGAGQTLSALERRPLPAAWSRIAEHESWRKELHRPGTYVHKWWARRLGTVFRHLLLAAAGGGGRGRARWPLEGHIVFDPFAGSGTTLVEAVKLGARVVARDINPIATLTQRQALQPWDMTTMGTLFEQVEGDCRTELESLHVAGDGAPTLHYFWVAVTACTTCATEVELFSNYIFAKHAYPRRHPVAHATCPACHAVCPVDLGQDVEGYCPECDQRFSFAGPVQKGSNAGRYFICAQGHRSSVLDALGKQPPRRLMYAKAVRDPSGAREYRPIDDFDRDLYERAASLLADSAPGSLVLPEGHLDPGVNTIQALRWGYTTWASFFNDRQLYCLGRIGAALRDLPVGPEREALVAAFSKTLEHHNVFCSYKGEGTGPVRSIFHNHVLRPERCSVEGNPWGSFGGSGGFADSLRRLQSANDYKEKPTDLMERSAHVVPVGGRSRPVQQRIVTSWAAFVSNPESAYVSTGDGGTTDLPDRSISLVVTDPPYVDNVHYSELADFFHAWMRSLHPYPEYADMETTRTDQEVQNTSPSGFRVMVTRVWAECVRVLRDDGLLVFSFHQAHAEGWEALMASLKDSGLIVTAVRVVVAEVTTSLAKTAAKAPNRIDVIVVCRKAAHISVSPRSPAQAKADALRQLRSLEAGRLCLGRGDVLSAVRASVLAQGTRVSTPNWSALRNSANVEAEAACVAWKTS
jgi:putative DNA methylase